MWKVKLSEKVHAEVVDQLEAKLATENIDMPVDTNAIQHQAIIAPADGHLTALKTLKQTNQDLSLFHGIGYAIEPTKGEVYAPFDGKVRFTFSTQHAFGIESDNGLSAIIHVGIGTVNLRGEGFNLHFVDGQEIHRGDLLMTFDRDIIRDNGYDDTIIMFFVDPKRIEKFEVNSGTIKHGDDLQPVTFK